MFQGLIPDVVQLAEQAGFAILTYWNNNPETQLKADNSPVTVADLAANQIIINGLRKLTPSTPILSEENSFISYDTRKTWHQWWIVDPLDGTKEFIAGNSDFTVNIALVQDGVVCFGVVFIPATKLCYIGGKSLGAWRVDSEGNKQKIKATKANPNELSIVASRRHGSMKQHLFLLALQQQTKSVLKNAGSSLKFCLLAEGSADCYPRFAPTCQWDTAAAQGVLEGAGGEVFNEKGEPLNYLPRKDYLNPNFIALADPNYWQKPIFDILNKVDAEN